MSRTRLATLGLAFCLAPPAWAEDLVVMAGGGGALYGRAIAALFPSAEVRLAGDPVGANARGFFRYGGR